jgi:hypothetical protein
MESKVLKGLIGDDRFEKYERLQEQVDENTSWCPKLGCYKTFEWDSSAEDAHQFKCPDCSKEHEL